MSKSAWRRSSDEARAGGGGSFLHDKSDKTAEEEESSEGGALIKKKTQTYQSHLKLVHKQIDMISAPTTSQEAPPADNVDTRTAGSTKHNGNVVTGATGSSPISKADKKQQKNHKQRENHKLKHRPLSFVNMGEVKQTPIESFPHTDNLPAPEDLPFNDLGKLIPTSVVINRQKKPSSSVEKKVSFAPATEENWGPAPPNQRKLLRSLNGNFDAPAVLLLEAAGGGGLNIDGDKVTSPDQHGTRCLSCSTFATWPHGGH